MPNALPCPITRASHDVALLEKFRTRPAAGFTVVRRHRYVNDIQQRITAVAGKADVIYTPASNLIQPAIAAVSAAARQIGIPIVNSDSSAVANGTVPASFSVDYEQVGLNAGKIAAEILNGKDPATIPPSAPSYENHAPMISKKASAAFGIEIPAEFNDCGCIVE